MIVTIDTKIRFTGFDLVNCNT